ncbi:MAG TPA: hypothetical protein VJ768_04715 [Anaerolineales bacterium]|nr:hypothetical protein [Anaerolineales bacterium]
MFEFVQAASALKDGGCADFCMGQEPLCTAADSEVEAEIFQIQVRREAQVGDFNQEIPAEPDLLLGDESQIDL